MPLPCKPSAEATKERRMEVFRLKMRGLTNSAISRELGVNRNTIVRDSKWVQAHLRELAVSADKFEEIGKVMAKLEEVEKEAFFLCNETENVHAKNNFLMTAINAMKERVKIMMDSGIIDRAAVDVNMSVDYTKMTTEELLRAHQEETSRIKQFGLEGEN